ncbi:sensor histidine kinase [Pseudomonas sp. OIL-1]|uniref:sensor histidine kinase n=1 Tax=Pseudomonas sp. OIL-1 TaxID=2706126 RepID=UPI0013A719C3|nr:sensor histidine kinase [Pseudomonas sp. OIL-1]QIB52328.1 histidine kinase [Pseudomonas sp. OIL-1]
MRTFVTLLLSLALGCIACTSASARITDEMDHRRWTVSDRGPGAVGALAQTADGYLWLGTHDSLYRFDGFEFEKFTSEGSESLGMVSALLSTSKGLWVGLRAGGVRLISPKGVLQPGDPGLPGGVIYGMAEDQQGQVWVAADDGLARHDGTAWQPFGEDAGFTERHARAVHVDADGSVWAASEEQLFALPPGASKFIPIAVKSQSISKITSSPTGDIWITDRARGQLLRLKKTDSPEYEIEEIPSSRTVSIVIDEHGDAWLGTLGSGVHQLAADPRSSLTEDNDLISLFTVRHGLSSNKVLTQLIDRDGNLWLGTDAGLDRLSRRIMTPLALPVGAGSHAMAVSSDGSLWVGTDNGQLIGPGGDSHSISELNMPITTLVNSQDHGLLIGGHRGIFSISDDGPLRIAALPVGSAREAAVRAMTVDKDGGIWVSINRTGLFVWADQHWRRIEPVSDAERQIMPVTASRDLTGKLWFGYRDNLLVSIDEQKIAHWGKEEGLDIGHVTAMLHLPGRTWMGGQYGLAYLENGRFHRLSLPAAGAFQNIYALVAVPAEKNAGNSGMDIWIHSRGGIFKLPAAEIERVIAGGDTLLYSSHDHIGQLPMDPYKVLPVPTAVFTPAGSLWFATEDGVVRVDPYRLRGGTQTSAVTIKSLTADGADLDISNASVRLSAAPEKLVITYSALNLSAPETMRFQYRLDGHNSEWVDAGRSRQATFPHLRPGDYEFQVRALGANGRLNLPLATLTVSIPQVFYLRPEFLLMSALALLALVLWMSRVHTLREKAALRTRLEERFQERERIARELHDTLLQSVQGMMLSFQAVADRLPKESTARHSMERALDRAEQVIAEGRDRITGLRGQMAPAEDLFTAFQALRLEAPESDSVTYQVSNIGQTAVLRSTVRDAFYQVGREAVLNSLRHAQATQVSVTFTYTPHRFEMVVADDGIGIDPVYQRMRGRPAHGGLRGMYERAERIDAKLSIISNVGSGTRINLSLPASAAYEHPLGSTQTRFSRTG